MITIVITLIFVFIILICGLAAKRFLYVNEHEESIHKELKTFNDNFETIKNIEVNLDYKMGSDHIYK